MVVLLVIAEARKKDKLAQGQTIKEWQVKAQSWNMPVFKGVQGKETDETQKQGAKSG